MSDRLLRLAVRTRNRAAGPDPERGDVPGWVMITLMTAGVVTAIWTLAEGALQQLFNDALVDVRGNRN